MEAVHLAPDSSIKEIAEFLEENGYVVIRDLQPSHVMDSVLDEISPYLNNMSPCKEEFFGGALRMFTGIIPKSAAYVELLDTPVVTQIAQHVLGDDPLLNATAIYALDTGGRGQTLHQDDETYRPELVRAQHDPQVMINMMWAVTDFTKENGATRLIPGSHRWPPERTPSPEDNVIQVTMPKGSLAVWLGSTYHGGGINHTSSHRVGAEMGFNLGWLRPYEAAHIVAPPELARNLPKRVQALLGYRAYRGILGIVDRINPDKALGFDGEAGAAHKVTSAQEARQLEKACREYFSSLATPVAPDLQSALERLAKANDEWDAALVATRQEVVEVTTNARANELIDYLLSNGMAEDVFKKMN